MFKFGDSKLFLGNKYEIIYSSNNYDGIVYLAADTLPVEANGEKFSCKINEDQDWNIMQMSSLKCSHLRNFGKTIFHTLQFKYKNNSIWDIRDGKPLELFAPELLNKIKTNLEAKKFVFNTHTQRRMLSKVQHPWVIRPRIRAAN